MLPVFIYCQDINIISDTITLDSAFNNHVNVNAKTIDWMKLAPGFKYEAASSNYFHSSHYDFGSVDEANITGGHPDTSISNLVGNDGVVGAIPGNFSVSPTGAALYNIPIECPPGINGMTPSISLTYNSQSGNGIAGYGWNIGGLSAITRGPKTYYYDDESEEIKWDDNDPLFLDGSRLIYQETIGDNKIYRLDNNLKTKIVQYNFSSPEESYIEVFHGDGKIYTYETKNRLSKYSQTVNMVLHEEFSGGEPIDAGTNIYYHTLPDVEYILSWRLTKIEDPFGNLIKFNYAENTSSMSDTLMTQDSLYIPEENILYRKYITTYYTNYKNFRLTSIEYGHENTSSYNILYTINLGYEGRMDHISQYISGKELLFEERLKTVNVKHESTSNNVLKYSLNYSTGDYSFIEDIELTGLSDIKYNKTIFQWEDNNLAFSQLPNYSYQSAPSIPQSWIDEGYSLQNKVFYPANFNGDLLTDFFVYFNFQKDNGDGTYTWKQYWVAYLNNNTTSLSNIGEGIIPENKRFYIIDKDKDQLDEVYFQYEHTEDYYLYIKFKAYEVNTSGMLERKSALDFMMGRGSYSDDELYLISNDFDGDRQVEHLLMDPNNQIYKRDGFETVCQTPSFPNYSKYQMLDFNSNGKVDLFFLLNNGFEIWEYIASETTFIKIYSGSSINKYDKVYPGDFNGDGNGDILIFDESSTTWEIFISDGKQLHSNIITPPNLNTYLVSEFDILLSDINMDGKTDIIESKKNWNGGTVEDADLNVYLQKSSGFDLKLTQPSISVDYLRFSNQIKNDIGLELTLGINTPLILSLSNDYCFNKLKKVMDGLGNSFELKFGYEKFPHSLGTLSNLEIPSTSGFYPVCTNNIFMLTLQEVLNETKNLKKSYDYGNTVSLNIKGGGFLGFESVNITTTSQMTGDSESYYEHKKAFRIGDTDKYLFLTDTTITRINETLVSKKIDGYGNKIINSKDYLTLKETETFNFINNTYIKTEVHEYNDYLSPTKRTIKVYQDGSILVKSDSISTSFVNNINPNIHLIGLPVNIASFSSRPGEDTYNQEKEFTYNSDGTVNVSYLNRYSNEEMKSNFVYDDFGNITQKKITASNDSLIESAAMRERITTFRYSQDGRFLLSKTNPLGFIDSLVYNESQGLISKKIDVNNNLEVSYEYDGFGNLLSITSPSKAKTIMGTRWIDNHSLAPSGSVYYTFKQSMGEELLIPD